MAVFEANVGSDTGFAPPNALFDVGKVIQTGQGIQNNQLMMQGKQIDLANANMDQVSRAAAGLLAAYPDEASRAAAYPQAVGLLQAQGLARNAPAQYPGEGALRALVAQSIPAQTQAEWLANIQANKAYSTATGTTTGAGTTTTSGTGTTGTPAAPGTIEPTAIASATAVRDGLIKRGMDPVTATAFAANKLHESGATLNSGPGDGGVSQGNFMWNGDRNTEYQQLYGHTPQGAPLDEQLDFVMHELNGKESNARDAINEAQGVDGKAAAISRYYLRPKDVVGETQRRAATALQLQRQIASTAQPGAPGGATAPDVVTGDATRPDLAPPPPGGTAGIPTPYQASGGGIGAVLGGTARAARPAGAPIVTDQPAGGGVVAGPAGTAVVGQPTPPSAAVPGNVGAINAGIARAGGTPAAVATPEPGWGTAIGQYGPQNQLAPPPAPPPVAQTPPNAATAPTPPQPGVRQPPQPPQPPPAAPLPPPPQMPVLTARGLTPQQQAQIDAVASTGRMTVQQRMAAEQAFVTQNVQLRQQAFSDYMQQQQLAVQQGTLSNAQAELNLKTWQAAHPVPTTPRFTGNSEAVWNPGTKQYEPVTPDNTSLGPHVAGSWGVNNTGQMQFLAGATRPAQGDFTEQAAAYHFDQPIVQAATTAGQTSQNSLIQLNELADLVNKGQASGPEGPFRKRVAEFMEQHGFTPDAIKSWTGMSSGSDADLLQKLAVATVGASAKADLGSNVGIQSLHLYENANPGMTMLGGANQKVTNMIRVTRAMQDDYTQGLQQHFNTNQSSFLHGGGYNEPVSVYNAQWQQRNNPQIGAAAMGILNGDEYGSWASRLGGSVQDATNAMKLAVRIDPNATMNTGHGQELVKDVLARAGTK
jgi:hypothetical protein